MTPRLSFRGGRMVWRGFSPRHVLVVFLAICTARCISSTCPALATPGGPYPSVGVAQDTALLAAILNQSVRNITILNDMVLGQAWTSLASPVVIQRNLSISGSRGVSVNLGTLKQVLSLGPGVTLQLKSLVLMQEGPKTLDPGLQIIGGGDPSSILQVIGVQMTELCCYPWQMWDRFIKDNQLAYASYNADTKFVCDKYSNCFDQQVTFGDLCSSASATNLSFTIRWSQVTMLCESSIADDCVAQNGTSGCLKQCYAASGRRVASPPLPTGSFIDVGPPTPGEQAAHSEQGNNTLTIVLATVIPAAALAAILAAAAYLWQRRKVQDHGASSTDIWKDGFGGLFRNREPNDVEAATAGYKSAGSGKSPALHASMKIGLSPAPTAPGNEREEEQQAGSAAGSAPAARNGSEDLAGQGPEGASRRGSAQALPAAAGQGSQPAAGGHSRQFFNAAEAVASLAASREQRGLAGDGDLMDLQRRVQQLAEQRLISEDEKLVLGRPIGRGAFGMVFHGLWRNLDVAVKTMLFSQNDGARQESALIEAALASSVVHPNVVSVYHFDMKPITVNPSSDCNPESLHVEYKDGQIDWKMYIVQELCQSSLAETLETWVFHDQQTGLPRMDLILSVLLDVACGCAHIHSKNIIWGDLKPGNVLLKMDPSKPHGVIAKITDFGMSTTIDPSLSHISNYNKGTPFYVAPEILLSHQATKTSDVFSFGILIQQMLTRSTPYHCTPSGAVEVNKQFWRPTPGSCSSVTDIRRRCLDQNPKNRPKFEEIHQTLQEAYESLLVHMPLPVANPALEAGEHPMPGSSAGDVGCDPSYAAAEQQQQQLYARRQQASAECATAETSERRTLKDALEAQSVPGRSASTTINEVASQLTVLQSRLFTNWPMSDGALQGMQMIDPSQGERHHGLHLDGQAVPDSVSDAHSSSNGCSSPRQAHALSSAKNVIQQDLFPHWSTQF